MRRPITCRACGVNAVPNALLDLDICEPCCWSAIRESLESVRGFRRRWMRRRMQTVMASCRNGMYPVHVRRLYGVTVEWGR